MSPASSSSSYPPERTIESAPSEALPEMPACNGRCTLAAESSARSMKVIPSGIFGMCPKIRCPMSASLNSTAAHSSYSTDCDTATCARRPTSAAPLVGCGARHEPSRENCPSQRPRQRHRLQVIVGLRQGVRRALSASRPAAQYRAAWGEWAPSDYSAEALAWFGGSIGFSSNLILIRVIFSAHRRRWRGSRCLGQSLDSGPHIDAALS